MCPGRRRDLGACLKLGRREDGSSAGLATVSAQIDTIWLMDAERRTTCFVGVSPIRGASRGYCAVHERSELATADIDARP